MAIRHIKRNTHLIARKLKAARIFRFGTAVELAAVSGLSTQAVASAERPDHNSTIATILAICDATGMPIGWLVEDAYELPDDWEKVVASSRITTKSHIPSEPPWKEFSKASETLRIKPHLLSRLRVLSRRFGISREELIHQLLNEGLAIKEAQFESVKNETLDVDLLRELADIYDQVEMDETRHLTRDEKNKIIKTIYFELEAKGMTAADISLSDIARLTS